MFFRKKSDTEKELAKYEQAFRGQGLDIKAPIGMSINMIHSGFRQQFEGLHSFLEETTEQQNAYFEKLANMMDMARSKGQNSTVAAAHIFVLYLLSAIEQDREAHTKSIEVMTDLSKAGDMVSD